MLSIFQELKADEFKPEFRMFGFAQLALPMITPALQDQVASWSPLAEPNRGVQLLLEWRPLLLDEDEPTGSPALDLQSTALFDALAEQLVVRKIQTCLTNEWDVQNARPCIALVEGLKGIEDGVQRRRALISQQALDNLLNTIIFPKLKRAVEEWRPIARQNRAGEWLRPWLPHLKSELASLMPSVRRKLSQSFEAWR